MQGQPYLFKMVRALHAVGGFADLLHGRQQQADEAGTDGDHDLPFDQRERHASMYIHLWNFVAADKLETGDAR